MSAARGAELRAGADALMALIRELGEFTNGYWTDETIEDFWLTIVRLPDGVS